MCDLGACRAQAKQTASNTNTSSVFDLESLDFEQTILQTSKELFIFLFVFSLVLATFYFATLLQMETNSRFQSQRFHSEGAWLDDLVLSVTFSRWSDNLVTFTNCPRWVRSSLQGVPKKMSQWAIAQPPKVEIEKFPCRSARRLSGDFKTHPTFFPSANFEGVMALWNIATFFLGHPVVF